MSEYVTVDDMAFCRECRAAKQKKMIECFSLPIVSFTMNIAGPVKRSGIIEWAFKCGLKCICEKLSAQIVSFEVTFDKTGCEALFSVNADAEQIKNEMMLIETGHEFGRWFDIDVISPDGRKLSRSVSRQCFICGEPAAACARSRKHPVSELIKKTEKSFLNGFRSFIVEVTSAALTKEVNITPKPGLVDRRNSGANDDMDISTFELSIERISPFFGEMAVKSYEHGFVSGELVNELVKIGKAAEDAMFNATHGVNTHKGAIFSIGLIVSAYAIMKAKDAQCGSGFVDECLSLAGKLAKAKAEDGCSSSNGAKVRRMFGIGGARDEAEAGYPIVKKAIAAKRTFQKNSPDPWTVALLRIMSELDDNNVFKRGGSQGAVFVKNRAKELLSMGSALSDSDLKKFDDDLIKKNISSGGCADMLAVAILIEDLEEFERVEILTSLG